MKLQVHDLPRSSWIVFIRLAMEASSADSPSLNAASSLVLNVEPDLALQSDHTDSASHWDSMEVDIRPHGTSPSVAIPGSG